MKNRSSAILLAAGKSERMGMPKFTLKFDANKIFLEEIADRFVEFGCEEIIIVMNRSGSELLDELKIWLHETVTVVINPHPESGRFSSIKIGLSSLLNRNNVFIHNIDNPFVDIRVLELLLNGIEQTDYCVPVYKNRGGHPILISEKVAGAIQKCSQDNLNLKEYLKAFEKHTVETNDPNILININTIEEYKELFP